MKGQGTVPRDHDCTNSKTAVEGNTCKSIADKRCTVSLVTIKSYNPRLDYSNFRLGQIFCCNAGAVPGPSPDCTNIKTVVEGNTCSIIADKRCTISLSQFQDYNPHIDCSAPEPARTDHQGWRAG
ncbi:carbohydrate-binding module family 50 protein [Parathielavia hyrcaniae]|uniref:Carbohydrate-binding module family 50 protein n=1 Tax=Parathielavia hyrcaniae TaxID=113614 RepID=A0AAN6PU91_9PEZI|nr:carbohydrate-binding module family 50 protein [Parathielavia hyrcaniae]